MKSEQEIKDKILDLQYKLDTNDFCLLEENYVKTIIGALQWVLEEQEQL